MTVLILTITLVSLAPNSSRATLASGTQPVVFADGILIDGNGSWMGIEPPSVEMPVILNSGATYVQVSSASTCNIQTGVPNPSVSKYFTQLKNAGVHLGVAMHLQDGCATSIYIQKAQYLLTSGWYDWIFLDGALVDPDLQTIVNALLQQGWTKITENDSRLGTTSQVVSPATGVWGHFSRFCLLETRAKVCASPWPNWSPPSPTILSEDIAFIRYVYQHFPTSIAVEEVEVPPETLILSGLPLQIQEDLLASWAQQQMTYGYSMLYPFFTNRGGGSDCYASVTCQYQTNLICQYNYNSCATTTALVTTITSTYTTSSTSTTSTFSTVTGSTSLAAITNNPVVTGTTMTTGTVTGPTAGTSTTIYTSILSTSTSTSTTILTSSETTTETGVTTISTASSATTTSTGTAFTTTTTGGTVTITETDTFNVLLTTMFQELHQVADEFLQLIGFQQVATPLGQQVNQIIVTTTTPVTMTVSYSVVGGGSPTAPVFHYVLNGVSNSLTLTQTAKAVSVDAGSVWSVTPNPLGKSSSTQQWYSTQSLTGTASATTIHFVFRHQYYLTMVLNGPGAVTPSSGWYNAGQKVTITATANPGHEFKSWTGKGPGSYTGKSASHTITTNAPITETANFD